MNENWNTNEWNLKTFPPDLNWTLSSMWKHTKDDWEQTNDKGKSLEEGLGKIKNKKNEYISNSWMTS